MKRFLAFLLVAGLLSVAGGVAYLSTVPEDQWPQWIKNNVPKFPNTALKFEDAWAKADGDKNGKVTATELRTVVSDQSESSRLFDKYSNKDGYIDQTNFAVLWKEYATKAIKPATTTSQKQPPALGDD